MQVCACTLSDICKDTNRHTEMQRPAHILTLTCTCVCVRARTYEYMYMYMYVPIHIGLYICNELQKPFKQTFRQACRQTSRHTDIVNLKYTFTRIIRDTLTQTDI